MRRIGGVGVTAATLTSSGTSPFADVKLDTSMLDPYTDLIQKVLGGSFISEGLLEVIGGVDRGGFAMS